MTTSPPSLTLSVAASLPSLPPRRRFTVREYAQMSQTGILHEDDQLELIDGEIIAMSPINPPHAACVKRLIRLFSAKLREQAIVSAQDPVVLSEHSEPQPDVTLLKPHPDFYAAAHPTPEEVLLVVEVADSTLEYDREVKARLYAEAGIAEMWLADLVHGQLEVYREPSAAGYRLTRRCLPGEQVSSLAFPDMVIDVKEILGGV